MIGKILTKLVKKAYKRDFDIERIGKRYVMLMHDSVGCNTYLLEGKYSYDEVVKLNSITTYSAGFGFCTELGPVAFIGIPNPECAWRDGYFRYNVKEYGSDYDKSECFFKAYTEEEAKTVVNYTVYGLCGLEEVAKVAPISKLNSVYDYRYKLKTSNNSRVFDMDCKLEGIYTYKEAKLLATGTIKDKEWFSGKDRPIIFARIENGKNIGIINMSSSSKNEVLGFRDVWEYGEEEPETQQITFLTKEEASTIKDFELYVYCYDYCNEKYNIEKIDRTFDVRFNFHLPNGRDYRLIDIN